MATKKKTAPKGTKTARKTGKPNLLERVAVFATYLGSVEMLGAEIEKRRTQARASSF